jgi:hypothetical protein
VQRSFVQPRGLDPIFRNDDGSNCENADIGTLRERRSAFSLLLERGSFESVSWCRPAMTSS